MSDIEERDPDQLEAGGQDDSSVQLGQPTVGAPAAPAPAPAEPLLDLAMTPADATTTDSNAPADMMQEDWRRPEDAIKAGASQQQELTNKATSAGVLADTLGVAAKHLGDAAQLRSTRDLVKSAKAFQQSEQDRAQEFQDQLQSQMLNYRKAVQDFTQFNPNPWANKSTGFVIGNAIALALNQFGIGISPRGGFNIAEKIISDAYSRDLQEQQLTLRKLGQNVETEGLLLGKMRQVFENEHSAFAAAHTAAGQLVEARLRENMMLLAPEKRTLEMQQVLATLAARNAEGQAKLVGHVSDEAIKLFQAKSAAEAQQAALAFKKSQAAEKRPVGLFASLPGLKGPELKAAEAAFDNTVNTIVPARESIKQFFELPVAEQVQPQNKAAFLENVNRVVQAVRLSKNQGVRQNPMIKKIDSLLATGSENPEGVWALLVDKATGGQVKEAMLKATSDLVDEADGTLRTHTQRGLMYWMHQAARHHLEEDQGVPADGQE